MTLEIFVQGRVFDHWETASIGRSIDANAGKFQFTSSNVVPADYPVRVGDAVRCMINGEPKLTGFCDVIESSIQDGSDTITVSGRDNTSDIIDSSMPDTVKTITGPVSFIDLCTKVISALGANIGVIQTAKEIDDFTSQDLLFADAGKNCMEFLTGFARKRQVYLIADGDGNLDIFRPPETFLSGSLINQSGGTLNNVISSSARFDHSQRYHTYQIRSQDNFAISDDYEEGIDRFGTSTDETIRSSRFLEVQSEESMVDETAKDRSIEEMNIRIGRSTSYKATVQGFERSSGVLWDLGQLTKIRDDYSGMKGVFIVRSVRYDVDLKGGSRSMLTMAPPEAYNVRLPTQSDKRRAGQGPQFQNEVPSTARFNR